MLESSQPSKNANTPDTGIHEINNLKEALQFVTEDSCLIYDIDKTIFDTAQYLGGDNWFRDHLSDLMKEGIESDQALHLTLPTYLKVQKDSKVKPVEDDTVELIEQMQNLHISFALTSRDGQLDEATVNQLDSLGLSFNQGIFKDQQLDINPQEHQKLLKGVIFCAGGRNKGDCLEKTFEHLNYRPKHIVFIDDVRAYLDKVHELAQKLDIPFTGLRYGFADIKPKTHNLKVAQKQLEIFQNPLRTDEEAVALIRAESRKSCGVVFQADREYGLIWAAEKQTYEAICDVLNHHEQNSTQYKQYRKKAKFYTVADHDELCTRFKVPKDELHDYVLPELKKLDLIKDEQVKYLDGMPTQERAGQLVTPLFQKNKETLRDLAAKPIAQEPVARPKNKQ